MMERMARSLTSCIRWFIDQHGMHSTNIGSGKAFNMVQNLKIKFVAEYVKMKKRKTVAYLWEKAKLEENLIVDKVLSFVVKTFT